MPILLSVLTSRVGQIILAASIGFGWGWMNTSARWRDYMAQQNSAREVLHQMELRRQAVAAKEIAAAATLRAESDTIELARLRKMVDDFDKGQTNAKDPCAMDDIFVGAAHKLRQPAKRPNPAPVARPPK